jgi:hypothetical protein
VLQAGAIHPDLVRRLAGEASRSALHVLDMCIRALDYLPPVDVTFFEYLRALITADFDLIGEDHYHYRVAFVEAFRRRGVYPANLDTPTADTPRTLSVDTLRWRGIDLSTFPPLVRGEIARQYVSVIEGLKRYADACFYLSDREKLFVATREQRRLLQDQLAAAFKAVPPFARELGLDPGAPFQVHELRRAMRVRPDGRHVPQLVVEVTQSRTIPENKDTQTPAYVFHGGSTMLVDLSVPEVKYCITKNVDSETRRDRTAAFVRAAAADPLRQLFFTANRKEPFAALHALAEENL